MKLYSRGSTMSAADIAIRQAEIERDVEVINRAIEIATGDAEAMAELYSRKEDAIVRVNKLTARER